MTRSQIIRQVKAIILKYAEPKRIWLYGSHANGEANPYSDIDIAFDAPEFKELWKIRQEVDSLDTLLKIDISNISFVDKRFRNRVISTGKVLYSSSKKLRAEDALDNFAKELERFSDTVERREEFEREGFGDIYLDLTLKRFEFTYEMSWKALKRYLDYLGISATNPRAVFREAYAQGILREESVWLDMIEMRNLSSHVYDEEEIRVMLDEARRFREAFEGLKGYLEEHLKNGEA
jgi:nucleotidyltransferase substrate binding protein (TIGR01987 family)